MGASGSVEPPDADELKRLFDKHDVTGSGNLERQEAQENYGKLGTCILGCRMSVGICIVSS